MCLFFERNVKDDQLVNSKLLGNSVSAIQNTDIFCETKQDIWVTRCLFYTAQLQYVHRTVVLTCVGKCSNFTSPPLSYFVEHDMNYILLAMCVFVFLLWQWHDIDMTVTWCMTVPWHMIVTWHMTWHMIWHMTWHMTYDSEMTHDSGSIGVINACKEKKWNST